VPISIASLAPAAQSAMVFVQSFFFDAPLTSVSLGPGSSAVVLDNSL
jgi:hypothetical protein